MKKVLGVGTALALAVGLLTAVVGTSTASADFLFPTPFCSGAPHTAPCEDTCFVAGAGVPCLKETPTLSGVYTFTSNMDASQQNNTGIPGAQGASGTATITMNANTNTLCATTTWTGINSPVVAGHIHGGSSGKPENPAVTIDLFPADFVNGKQSGASGCTTVPAYAMWVMNQCPSEFSTVVHSKANPVGAIRGQLGGGCRP